MTEQERQYVRQLEQAVLEAESVMADWQTAQRKGYIRNAKNAIFNVINQTRKHIKQQKLHSQK